MIGRQNDRLRMYAAIKVLNLPEHCDDEPIEARSWIALFLFTLLNLSRGIALSLCFIKQIFSYHLIGFRHKY